MNAHVQEAPRRSVRRAPESRPVSRCHVRRPRSTGSAGFSRRATAHHRRRRDRQDQYARASCRASVAQGRRARANPAADLHAPRRAGDAAPGGAHRRASAACRPSARACQRQRRAPALVREPSTRSAIACCASTRRSSGWSRRSRCSIAATPPTCWTSCGRSSAWRRRRSAFRARTPASRSIPTASTAAQPLARTLEEVFPWCSDWGDELTQLFRRYVEVKHAQQLLDYDDLLLYWHILDAGASASRARSAGASSTCWSTSTRTRTRCRRRSCTR